MLQISVCQPKPRQFISPHNVCFAADWLRCSMLIMDCFQLIPTALSAAAVFLFSANDLLLFCLSDESFEGALRPPSSALFIWELSYAL